MNRLVNFALVIGGVYLAIFYALLPPDPCRGTCPNAVFILPTPIFLPDPAAIDVVSIALGAVALFVGLVSLMRGGGLPTSMVLGIVGTYLLILRYLWSSGPARSAEGATLYPPVVAWLSLALGIAAAVMGVVSVVRGGSSAQIR